MSAKGKRRKTMAMRVEAHTAAYEILESHKNDARLLAVGRGFDAATVEQIVKEFDDIVQTHFEKGWVLRRLGGGS